MKFSFFAYIFANAKSFAETASCANVAMARPEMLGDLQSLFGPNDTQAGDGVGRCFPSALITFSRQFGFI